MVCKLVSSRRYCSKLNPTLPITDTKLYVSVVTLSSKDNSKLLEQSKSHFKRTINWNRFQFKIATQTQNRYLDFLINPILQGVNRLLVLSFKNENYQRSYKWYCLPTVELKDYDRWKKLFWSISKKWFKNIW